MGACRNELNFELSVVVRVRVREWRDAADRSHVWIGAELEQDLGDTLVQQGRRPVQRRFAKVVGGIDVGASPNEQADALLHARRIRRVIV